MRESRITLLVLPLLLAPILLPAQTRENSAPQVQADAPQAQLSDGAAKAAELPLTRDSLSTSVTSAPVALGPGDLLEVSVFDTPELAQRVRVNSDGKITLALIGEIPVRGLSPDALQELIRRRLIDGRFVKDPQVSVFVVEYAGQMAYVTGEVMRPGAYPLLRAHRLLDLISVAGGLSSRAGNTVTIARHGDSAQLVRIDLLDADENRRNPEVMPGDSITVSQTGIVYVLGDVQRPGGFLLDRRSTLSVMQALALAEGAKPSATLAKASLIRTSQGRRQETPLNLKMILKSQSPDFQLLAGDIIFVPGSLTHGMGRRSLEILMETAGVAAVYAAHP